MDNPKIIHANTVNFQSFTEFKNRNYEMALGYFTSHFSIRSSPI